MTRSFTVKLKTNRFWGYREAEISENGKPVYRMICNKHRGLKFNRDYSLETAGGKKVLDLQEMKINGKLVYEISKNQSTLCRVTGHVPYGGSFDRFEMKTFDSRLPSHAAKVCVTNAISSLQIGHSPECRSHFSPHRKQQAKWPHGTKTHPMGLL